MATGGMNASSTSPDTSGYSGPAPTFGGGPFLSPTGGGTPPSMTATPPTNPNPAPPSPQPAVMPATGPAPTPVMPSYGEHRRPDFGGSMDWAQGMMPQRGGFGGFNPFMGFGFGRGNQGPANPAWSQRDGVYNYNPNGGSGGMASPFIGNMMDRFGQKQQMLMDRVAQQRQAIAGQVGQALPQGLGAINPYNQAPTQRAMEQQALTTSGMQQYNPQMAGPLLTPAQMAQMGVQVTPQVMLPNPAYGRQLSGQSVAPQVSGGQASQSALEQSYQDFLRQQQPVL